MISLPARAIEVNFWEQELPSEARKLNFRIKFAPFGMEIAQNVLINDKLAGQSSIKSFLNQKYTLNHKHFSISRNNQFRRSIENKNIISTRLYSAIAQSDIRIPNSEVSKKLCYSKVSQYF